MQKNIFLKTVLLAIFINILVLDEAPKNAACEEIGVGHVK